MNVLKTSVTAAFLVAAAPAISAAATNMPEIYGSVIYADGWTQQENEVGMYRIPTSEDMDFVRLGDKHIDSSAGGVLVGNSYWSCYFIDFSGTPFVYVCEYDADTWAERNFYYADVPVISTGVAYDSTDGKVYGCFRNDSNNGYVFGTVDYQTLTRNRICDLQRMWSAVAVSRTGTIYAIDDLGDLYTVSKTDGKMTKVGSTGLAATNPSSACIDPRSGRLFYAVTIGTDGSLYEIDTTSAKAELIYHFPKNQEVVGMFIRMPEADDNAPDAPTDLKFSFPNGALSGEISFTTPSNTFGGAPGNGPLEYLIESDNEIVAHGSCSWNTEVNVPVSFSMPALRSFKVTLSNNSGKSPAIEETLFIGKDKPTAPVVNATRSGNAVTLTWKKVESSLNGGFIDKANLRYKVIRIPDDKLLASGTADLSITDNLPSEGDLTAYSYSVSAFYDDITSDEYISDRFWTGSLTPPFNTVFNDESAGEPYTVVDGNKDDITFAWDKSQNAFKTTFNRASDTDDWLITPAVSLKGGLTYKYIATLRTYNGNPEMAEIKWGSEATPAGLSNTLLPVTQIKTRESREYVGYITPETDGKYYIGVHCVTPAQESWYLYVDAMSIEAPVGTGVPAKIDDFRVTGDYDGALSAQISFTAPSLNAAGEALSQIDRIEIRRDGSLVKLISSPAPGSTVTYTDNVPASGYYIYEAVPYNEFGPGQQTETRVFVGVNCPARPEWVKLEETETPGTVKISWKPVDRAEDGSPLNPDLVRYDIITADESNGGEPYNVAEGFSGSEFIYTVPGADKVQKFVYYAIKAVTDYDVSFMAITPFIPVGKSYTLPYKESYSGGNAKSLMRPEDEDAMWSLYKDDSGIPAQDGDMGMAGMFGQSDGASASLFSGKISLKGASNPMLMLYTYNIVGAAPDLNELHISISDGSGFEEVRNVVMSELGEADGWYPVLIPLSAYKDKDIQFSLRGVTRNRQFTLVDNITVSDAFRNDLAAGLITVPQSVAPAEKFRIETGVENVGLLGTENYTVTLECNGKAIASLNGRRIEPGKTAIFGFDTELNVAMPENNIYKVRIDYAEDENIDNNTSADAVVRINFLPLPLPENVRGNASLDGVSLSWDEADAGNGAPEPVTEDFEGWTSWSKNGEHGWTFIDRDRSGVGAIQNVQLPGIDYNSELSWFVLDSSLDGLDNSFKAASGNKYLSSLFCLPLGDFNYVANDDWAISPELCGSAQRISLMARSINESETRESFQLLYSTEDTTDPDKFVEAGKVEAVPGAWTRYEFDLPDGARHFAIRYDKTYGFMLHIDDVKYIPAGKVALNLKGYNVYRDGELMTETPLKVNSYSDSMICSEDVVYAVSALYDEGESRAVSLTLNLGSGVESMESGTPDIKTGKGFIEIHGADGKKVEVYDSAAMLVVSKTGEGSITIQVSPGIYLIKVGTAVSKVIVR